MGRSNRDFRPVVKFAVLERTFSPSLPSPMTYAQWMAIHHRLDGCLEARNVHWLYSLVSTQGDRSICLFQVPYADTVREACREAGMPFQKVWQADLWQAQDPKNLPQEAFLVIAEVKFDPPMTKTVYEANQQRAEQCLTELNVRYAGSIVTLDGRHSICVFAAPSAEDVRSLYRKVAMPFERIWKATLIKPLSE